ncbi:MAG: 3-hydroxyacyl-CoA dehydrogenase [Pseudomonadota bacterium]
MTSVTSGTLMTLGLVGTGVMGRGIAQIAAQAGLTVLLYDSNPAAVAAAIDAIGTALRRLADKGKLPAAEAAAAAARLQAADGLQAFASCDCVVEAIVEKLDAKQQLLGALEAIVRDDCILATNTSSLSVTAIAAATARPERVVGWHFFNPVPLMKVVEVIPGLRTAPAVAERMSELSQRLGHRPVRCQDTPGFIVNHAGRGYVTEALRIVGEGVADFATVDRILREGAGFRMGPFELLDLTGLDVSHPVMEQIYHQFYQEPRFRPSPITRQRLEAGLLGRKTGAGFYRYDNGTQVVEPEESASGSLPAALWLAPDAAAPAREIQALAAHAGVPVETGERPGPHALCLVCPLGEDATQSVVRHGLDPERTVALDPLTPFARRRTLMTNPLTAPATLAAAQALLGADGVPVSCIGDSAGFVAQRVIATIVNIGCDIAQQRIATPQDIDAAVTLGLGYPRGPLAWGDAVGPGRIVEILEAMQRFYGDPRYRVSPWLKRRALLGASLHSGAA